MEWGVLTRWLCWNLFQVQILKERKKCECMLFDTISALYVGSGWQKERQMCRNITVGPFNDRLFIGYTLSFLNIMDIVQYQHSFICSHI